MYNIKVQCTESCSKMKAHIIVWQCILLCFLVTMMTENNNNNDNMLLIKIYYIPTYTGIHIQIHTYNINISSIFHIFFSSYFVFFFFLIKKIHAIHAFEKKNPHKNMKNPIGKGTKKRSKQLLQL